MAAVGAEHAAVLIDDAVLSALRAYLADDFGAVRHILLQGAGDAVLPGVDVVFFNVQVLDELDDILYGHAMAQNA